MLLTKTHTLTHRHKHKESKHWSRYERKIATKMKKKTDVEHEKKIVYNYKNGTKNKRCWHNSINIENLSVISPSLFVFIFSLCQTIEQQRYTCFSYDYNRYHVLRQYNLFLAHTLIRLPFGPVLMLLWLAMAMYSLNIDRLMITQFVPSSFFFVIHLHIEWSRA